MAYDQIELFDRDALRNVLRLAGLMLAVFWNMGAAHLHPLNLALGLARAAAARGLRDL